MMSVFSPMDEASARAILAWRYEAPYTLYNLSPEADVAAEVAHMLGGPSDFYAVRDDSGVLVAFRCFGLDGRVPGGRYNDAALDTGGGLRPDLTGRGLGADVMRAGLNFGQQTYHPPAFRVSVAAFNARALRTCEKVGYRRVSTFYSPPNDADFVILVRPTR